MTVYIVKEYCNGELVKMKTCRDKQTYKATKMLWKSAPCENQQIITEYISDDEVIE